MKSILKRLMTHDLRIRKRVRDWEGSFSDSKVHEHVRGFVQYGTKLVTDRTGEQVAASAIVFLPDTISIDPSHELMIDQVSHIRGYGVIRIDPIDDRGLADYITTNWR